MVTVMEIDTRRLIGVTQARQQLSSLLDDVAEGKPFHLMRENTVIAHLVPARALIVNNSNLESTLVLSVILETARRFAQEVIDERRQKNVDDGTDLLSRCLSIGDDDGLPFSDKYLRDIIMNFMYAQTSPLCLMCWLKSTFAHSRLAVQYCRTRHDRADADVDVLPALPAP